MMLASNLIAWTRNFLKMGGMEDNASQLSN